jgi:hypothetical protein
VRDIALGMKALLLGDRGLDVVNGKATLSDGGAQDEKSRGGNGHEGLKRE